MLFTVVLLVFMAMGTPAVAKVIQEKHWIDARDHDAYGKEVDRKIMVTLFYDDAAPKPYPLVVINHGQSSDAQVRRDLGRVQYSVASTRFAQRGFMVAVPTPIGYGVTAGPDVEDTGTCDKKNYPPGYAASAAHTLTVLAHFAVGKR